MSRPEAGLQSASQGTSNGQRRSKSRRLQHGKISGGTIVLMVVLLLLGKAIKIAAEKAETLPRETNATAAQVQAAATSEPRESSPSPQTDWTLLVPHMALYQGSVQLEGGLYDKVRATGRFERDCEKWQSSMIMTLEPEETHQGEISAVKVGVFMDEWFDGTRYVEISSTFVGEDKVSWQKLDVTRLTDGTSSGVLDTWDVEREEPWDSKPVTLPVGVKFFHATIISTLEAVRAGESPVDVLTIDTDEEGLIVREVSEISEYRPGTAAGQDPTFWLVKTMSFPGNGAPEPMSEMSEVMTADGFTYKGSARVDTGDIEMTASYYKSLDELMPFPCPVGDTQSSPPPR